MIIVKRQIQIEPVVRSHRAEGIAKAIPRRSQKKRKEATSLQETLPLDNAHTTPDLRDWLQDYPHYATQLKWLSQYISGKRFLHSIGVMEKSRELATRLGLSEADIERASLAGLLHDAAKLLPKDELLARAEAFNLPITEAHRQSPQTLHPLVGAALVQSELSINDEDILNAIRSHTTGRAEMSVLERIVYVADKIEGRTRDADFITEVEAIMTGSSFNDLDSGLRYILNDTIEFLTQRGQAIHPDTLAARDDLLKRTLESTQEDTRC